MVRSAYSLFCITYYKFPLTPSLLVGTIAYAHVRTSIYYRYPFRYMTLHLHYMMLPYPRWPMLEF